MRKLAPLTVSVVALFSSAVGADTASALAELANTLRQSRFLPNDLQSSRACPGRLGELVGISKKAVLDALGAPDMQEGVTPRDADPYTLMHYDVQRTTVTFKLSSSNFVLAVSCT